MAIRDEFPTRVTTPSGEIIGSARAFLSDDGFFVVWRREADGTISPRIAELVDEGAINLLSSRDGWSVQNSNGTYEVRPGGGCGCGDPLKRWNALRSQQEYEAIVAQRANA